MPTVRSLANAQGRQLFCHLVRQMDLQIVLDAAEHAMPVGMSRLSCELCALLTDNDLAEVSDR